MCMARQYSSIFMIRVIPICKSIEILALSLTIVSKCHADKDQASLQLLRLSQKRKKQHKKGSEETVDGNRRADEISAAYKNVGLRSCIKQAAQFFHVKASRSCSVSCFLIVQRGGPFTGWCTTANCVIYHQQCLLFSPFILLSKKYMHMAALF